MRIDLQPRARRGADLSSRALRIDASVLAPDRLAALTAAQIAQLELRIGRDLVPVGDVFLIKCDAKIAADTTVLRIRTDGLTLDRLGLQMASGRLIVEGDAGGFAGQQMSGGEMQVFGSAGAYAGCEMRGGKLSIERDAGDFLAAVLPGNNFGMRGGQISVRGNVGERAGDRMRRGLVIIRGSCAAWCASRMVAGTMIVMGRLAANPGFGLLHGTLISAQMPQRLLPGFGDCGSHRLAFLRLLADAIKPDQPSVAARLLRSSRVQRFAGDHAVGGKGELLVLPPRSAA